MDTRQQDNTREGRHLVLSGIETSAVFRDKLREIRDTQARRGEERRRAKAETDLERTDRMIHSYEWLDRIEDALRRYADDVMSEHQAFGLSRSFYEGKYRITLSADEMYVDVFGDPVTTFSRLSFRLDPSVEDGTFVIECRATVRGRDVETRLHAGHMDDGELPDYEAFIEERFVAFAQAYFANPKASATSALS